MAMAASAAAAAAALPPWVVLDRLVSVIPHDSHKRRIEKGDPRWGDDPTARWVLLSCRDNSSYGCNRDGDGDWVVSCLTLRARVVDPPGVSTLCIEAAAELVEAKCSGDERLLVHGRLVASDDRLFVLGCHLWVGNYHRFLIYDAAASSLVMMADPCYSPSRWYVHHAMGSWAYPVRGEGSDAFWLVFLRGHEKAILSERDYAKRLQICLWSPSSPRASSAAGPVPSLPTAIVKPLTVPPSICDDIKLLCIHETFSCGGTVFWVDLMRGALCCDAKQLFQQDSVQLKFIDLPPVCKSPNHSSSFSHPTMYRTMACVKDSVKFVAVDMHLDDKGAEILPPEPRSRRVTMWTLVQQDQGTYRWNLDSELLIGDLWDQPGYMRAGLLECPLAPKNPVLNAENEGVLCLTIGGRYYVGPHPDSLCSVDKDDYKYWDTHMISIDMHRKCFLNYTHHVPTMWTLVQQDQETYRWNLDSELLIGDLWDQPGYMRARLPECPLAPKNPVLNAENEGVLCLTIGGRYYVGPHPDSLCSDDKDDYKYWDTHMITIDMHRKCFLNYTHHVPNPFEIRAPVFMGSSLFKHFSSSLFKVKLPKFTSSSLLARFYCGLTPCLVESREGILGLTRTGTRPW